MKKLTVEQNEYLVSKINELKHSIDIASNDEYIDIKKLNELKKTLAQLEKRILNITLKH